MSSIWAQRGKDVGRLQVKLYHLLVDRNSRRLEQNLDESIIVVREMGWVTFRLRQLAKLLIKTT